MDQKVLDAMIAYINARANFAAGKTSLQNVHDSMAKLENAQEVYLKSVGAKK